jgi:nucleotidyltransferase substrate binding protein (TIGR01987 family)
MKSNRANIIKEVVKIILQHTKPERIYLYGSEALGESKATSDIDIAFNDKNFTSIHLIENEIQKIDTLLKIDVVNIAFTEERFKNRVEALGKVLFSATKKLRAEDGFYNFKNARVKFTSAIERENEIKLQGFEDIYLDLIVKRFEYTYEMSWKALKRVLEFLGLEANNPRNVFKEAFAQGLIKDEEVWLDMIEQRNLSNHVYDEQQIKGILKKTKKYNKAFISLEKKLEKTLG